MLFCVFSQLTNITIMTKAELMKELADSKQMLADMQAQIANLSARQNAPVSMTPQQMVDIVADTAAQDAISSGRFARDQQIIANCKARNYSIGLPYALTAQQAMYAQMGMLWKLK